MAAACRLVAIGLGCLTAIWPALVATNSLSSGELRTIFDAFVPGRKRILAANERERSGNANAEPDRALFGRSNFAGPKGFALNAKSTWMRMTYPFGGLAKAFRFITQATCAGQQPIARKSEMTCILRRIPG